MATTSSKRLHFIVRNDDYAQSLGYGYFLDRALSKLNGEKPADAKTLIERTAQLLQNQLDPKNPNVFVNEQLKNGEVFADCLPPELRKSLGIQNGSLFDQSTPGGQKNTAMMFGPAAHVHFGLLYADLVGYTEKIHAPKSLNHPVRGTLKTDASGWAMATDTLTPDDKSFRGYFDAIAQHYDIKPDSIPKDFRVSFDYTIPGTDRKLQLMRIASPESLVPEFRQYYKGNPDTVNNYMVKGFLGQKQKIVLLHPNCNREFMGDLIKCLDPLLKIIDAEPTQPVPAGTTPPDEKIDAISTAYWLLAQTTPIVRGGSANANVILEHMAHRLRKHGYDYEIPYTKQGVDFWAQAATLPLEDTEKLQGFKSRFREGQFFDRAARDEDVQHYFEDKLKETHVGRTAFNGSSQQGAGTGGPR